MKYRYFVSYYIDTNGKQGYGNTVFQFTDEINSYDAIKAIENELCEKLKYDMVIIQNFKLLEKK